MKPKTKNHIYMVLCIPFAIVFCINVGWLLTELIVLFISAYSMKFFWPILTGSTFILAVVILTLIDPSEGKGKKS